MMQRRRFQATAALFVVLAISAGGFQALGQEFRRIGSSSPMQVVLTGRAGSQGTYRFVNSHAAFNLNTIKGAPYSADAVTTTTQILPDGNRIFREQSSFVARDSEGRTRQEVSLPMVGAWVPENDGQRQVLIYDPVEKFSYTLDPVERTARRSPIPIVVTSGDLENETSVFVRALHVQSPEGLAKEGGEGVFIVRRTSEGVKVESTDGKPAETKAAETQVEVRSRSESVKVIPAEGNDEPSVSRASVHFFSTEAGAGPNVLHFNGAAEEGEERTEDLGTKTLQGVLVEGTRTTRTIEAGKLGNDLPIEIIRERWYSPDLQTEVMTRYYDPRVGETIFQLKNLSRSEPSPDLFEIPADYEIKSDNVNFNYRQRF